MTHDLPNFYDLTPKDWNELSKDPYDKEVRIVLEFNNNRHLRGVPAARIGFSNSGEETDYFVWMGIDDLRKTIKQYGKHPVLLEALHKYGITEKCSVVANGKMSAINKPILKQQQQEL
jgi:hypothetical protein